MSTKEELSSETVETIAQTIAQRNETKKDGVDLVRLAEKIAKRKVKNTN